MDIRRLAAIKDSDEIIGYRTRVKVVKNKLAPPFREAEFDIIFGQGLSREGEILDMATDAALITKSGAWYSYGTERLAQGREKAKAYLKEHPEFTSDLEKQLRGLHGLLPMDTPSAAEPVLEQEASLS
jgi:recombination protein RecA